jgi:hypothetical protein
MNDATLVMIAVVLAIASVAFALGARALKGQAERWAILGAVLTLVGTAISIIGILIQHSDAIHYGNPGAAQSVGSAPLSSYSSSVISLATNSPLRKRIPSMDDICGDLGQSRHAWLPGQKSPTNYTGRVIFAPNAAFTWSCTEGGPKLSPADITRGCQIWYSGSKARTWDRNNAYSWVCI